MGQGNFEWPDVNPANVTTSKRMLIIVLALYIIIVTTILLTIPERKTGTENQPGAPSNNAPTEQTT